MTFPEARRRHFSNLVLGALAFISGFSILFVTFLKAAYATTESAVLFSNFIRNITRSLYYRVCNEYYVCVVQWLWPWVSDVRLDGTLRVIFNPSIVAGFALVIAAAFLLDDARRLKTWMREVKALLAKENMRDSLKPNSNRQSIGDIQAGRDLSVVQEITNHYNHRPDRPKYAVIVAVIGAVAAIIAAWLKKGQ